MSVRDEPMQALQCHYPGCGGEMVLIRPSLWANYMQLQFTDCKARGPWVDDSVQGGPDEVARHIHERFSALIEQSLQSSTTAPVADLPSGITTLDHHIRRRVVD